VGRAGIGLLYIVVVTVFVGVSVWTFREGFASLLGNLSWPIAVAFGCCLFAADMVIRNKRAANQSLVRPVLFLLLCMLASAPSHFNYFYNYALGHIIAQEKLTDAGNVFDKNVAAAMARLASANTNKASINEIDDKLNELLQQINDDGRSGWGTRAQALYDRLRVLARFAELKTPAMGTDRKGALEFYDRVKNLAVAARDASENANPVTNVQRSLESMVADVQSLTRRHKVLSLQGPESNAAAIDAIQQIYDLQRKLETTVNQTLINAAGAKWQLPHPPVAVGEAIIEGVANSVRSGWIEMKYPHVTAVAALATTLIDLIPFMFVLLLIAPEAIVVKPPGRPVKINTATSFDINQP